MNFVESIDQVFSALFIWVLGFILIEIFRQKFFVKQVIAHILYLWHSLFGIVYMLYLSSNAGDAKKYYTDALMGDVAFGFGTQFVNFLTSIFVLPFNLSFMGAFLVFNIFGSLGLLAFYASLHEVVKEKSVFIKRLAVITVFLPSVSFWTVAIGKDSLAFMSIGFALWASLNLKRRTGTMIFTVIAMLMIRPHIAGIFIVALSIAFVLDKNISLFPRVLLGFLSILAVSIMIPFALNYVGLENLNQASQVTEYVEQRQSYNQSGGGDIDISSMSLPVQMFTYIFRPLPFEAHSVSALLASLDNLFLLFIFLLFLRGLFKNKRSKTSYNITFMIAFSIVTWLVLAMTTANLGIAIRQKWMFMPFLIFIFFLYMRSIKFKRKEA